MNICGEDYTLVADETSAYMEKVGSLVSQKMRELMDSAHVGRTDAAVLTALNMADELFKTQEASENLRRQLKTYLEEATRAKSEVSELKRQLFKLQNQKG
jgi:cell division protein ZapA